MPDATISIFEVRNSSCASSDLPVWRGVGTPLQTRKHVDIVFKPSLALHFKSARARVVEKRPEDARTPAQHGHSASQAPYGSQNLLPPFPDHIPANSQQFTFPFPPSFASQNRSHLEFRPPTTPAYGYENHHPQNYPATQLHRRNGPPYAPTSQLRQPPPRFAPLSTLSDSRALSSTYTRPPSPPPISEDDLIDPMQISEVAQSKKRQHESDEENQPPAPAKRPRPRPITRTQQSVDPTAQKTSSRPASRTSTTKSKAPEHLEGESDAGALLPKPKPKPKPRARASAKASKDAAAHGGRKKGASNYSIEEDRALLTMIEKFLPIGGKTWETVANEYKRWCAARQHPIRDNKSIRARYGVILKHAQSKPTGDPERGEDDPYHIILRVEDMITAKSGQLTIDDSEFEDNMNTHNGGVIDISSDEGPHPPPAKFVAAKAYKASTAPAPDTKPRRGSNLAAATNTLTAIGAVFNPGAMQARDDQRMSNSVHLTQIASLQVENRELRMRMDSLQDRLQAETRRADKAETQVEMYSMFSKQTSRHRRRSHRERYSSDDGSSSASGGHHSYSRRPRHHAKKLYLAPQSPTPQPRQARTAHRETMHAHEARLFPPTASSSAVKVEDLPLPPPDVSMSPFSISMPPRSPSPVGVTLTFTPQKGSNGQLMLDVTPKPHHTT